MTQQDQPLKQQFFPITLISSCLPTRSSTCSYSLHILLHKTKPTKASTTPSQIILNAICNFALKRQHSTKLEPRWTKSWQIKRVVTCTVLLDRVSFDSPLCWLNCERMCLCCVLGSRHFKRLVVIYLNRKIWILEVPVN